MWISKQEYDESGPSIVYRFVSPGVTGNADFAGNASRRSRPAFGILWSLFCFTFLFPFMLDLVSMNVVL